MLSVHDGAHGQAGAQPIQAQAGEAEWEGKRTGSGIMRAVRNMPPKLKLAVSQNLVLRRGHAAGRWPYEVHGTAHAAALTLGQQRSSMRVTGRAEEGPPVAQVVEPDDRPQRAHLGGARADAMRGCAHGSGVQLTCAHTTGCSIAGICALCQP